ncbi:MAG: tRNA (adenosine(37)-N6)-threonylcarbamoyltransferase complex ATPase subunit type 1 TsaE [bacterium]|nr:tRNA (adenosine(37)-N6)-threonylcarbamoyltransferase complex ATPase subunit type 1 TsaE [bacterium]
MIETFQQTTNSEQETIKLGENLSRYLMPGDVVALLGELGSGKTCLVRGICKGLECADQVTSPTFTLINEYRGRFPVYHFDFYRLESEQEIFDLGYEEYFFGDGICLVEWAERALPLLPQNYIEIRLRSFFEPGRQNCRELSLTIHGKEMQKRKLLAFFHHDQILES